jgi:hypothetical protein
MIEHGDALAASVAATTNIFTDAPERDMRDFGKRPTLLRHGLASSDLFTDAALARLIEATPRERMHVNTMPRDGRDPRSWREGERGALSGEATLQAVKTGRLWLHLQQAHLAFPAYAQLLDAMFDEVQRRAPHMRTFKRSLSLLISSPGMNVAYHSDVPGQSLWQIRGRKRLWLYPPTDPFLPQTTVERIALKRAMDTDFAFRPEFDASARIFDLTPGDMACWPRNAPHRVENADCLNVSVTTEHWTRDLAGDYAVDYANGLLRGLGARSLSRRSQGVARLAKIALAGAHKAARRLARDVSLPLSIDFRVDPDAPGGFVDIPPRDVWKSA